MVPDQEKEFTRLRDELSKKRRELPWEKVSNEFIQRARKNNIAVFN